MRIIAKLWLLISLALLAWGFYQAMYIAPTEMTMGDIQRIFYWHVPINIVGLTLPYVNMIASIAYLALRRRSPALALKADALAVATAEATVLVVGIGLVTGMIWARPVWGIWWTWDARLTSYLVLWLLYVSYLLLRRFAAPGQSHTLAAVLSVFAGVDVPIVYYSIQWWRTQHPQPVTLDATMVGPFVWNIVAWFMYGIWITGVRYTLERRLRLRDQAEALTAIESYDTTA